MFCINLQNNNDLLNSVFNIYFYMSVIQQKPLVNGSIDLKWLEIVTQNVKSLRYGVVEIIVHDSRVLQLEKTERVRLDKPELRPEQT